MKTKELFRENMYLKAAAGKVLAILEKDGKVLVELDQTIFFPTGGGQSCDLGTMDGFKVLDVYIEDKVIYHQIDGPLSAFSVGQEVQLEIDWQRRFANMQRHCGEHILTGIFYKLYGGVNRGFHMGDDYMTIDISMEEDPNFKTITWDMAKEAELETNQVIWENQPMIFQHFDSFKEASKVPMRKKLTVEEDITLVGIGSPDAGWGCVACCGTHPATTGQVGLVKVYKVEANKGMFRIYFEAGKRAFLNYQKELDVLSSLGSKLSAGTDDLLEKYQSQQDKVKEVKTHLHQLNKYINEKEVASLGEEMSAAFALGETVFSKAYDVLSIDDLLQIGRKLIPEISGLACLIHSPSNTILLFSNGDIDCGKLVKENASIYNGKGGGNNTSARAIFDKEEYIETFIVLLEKHLR